MHLLYLDESGSAADPSQNHFVLAGVSIFERKTHWIEQKLNEIAQRFDANHHSIELHGSSMRSGRDGWKSFPLSDRLKAIKDALNIIHNEKPNGIRLFGAVISKSSLAGEQDPVVLAFEQVASRFDMFLGRLFLKYSNPQRGIILFDKSSTEMRIQTLAKHFKYHGHTWGKTNNYAEVPVFLDSKASRLIQLADLVAFALYRYYEAKDNTFFDIIKGSFDQEGGVVHGLYTKLNPRAPQI